jgi:hypothetical protein
MCLKIFKKSIDKKKETELPHHPPPPIWNPALTAVVCPHDGFPEIGQMEYWLDLPIGYPNPPHTRLRRMETYLGLEHFEDLHLWDRLERIDQGAWHEIQCVQYGVIYEFEIAVIYEELLKVGYSKYWTPTCNMSRIESLIKVPLFHGLYHSVYRPADRMERIRLRLAEMASGMRN